MNISCHIMVNTFGVIVLWSKHDHLARVALAVFLATIISLNVLEHVDYVLTLTCLHCTMPLNSLTLIHTHSHNCKQHKIKMPSFCELIQHKLSNYHCLRLLLSISTWHAFYTMGYVCNPEVERVYGRGGVTKGG